MANENGNRVSELVEEIEKYKETIYNAENAMNAAEDELQELLYLQNLEASKNDPYN